MDKHLMFLFVRTIALPVKSMLRIKSTVLIILPVFDQMSPCYTIFNNLQ